jgi:ferric-dicitrate binding protein FerR (iron transport regulator)
MGIYNGEGKRGKVMRRIYQISMILLMAWFLTGPAIAYEEPQYGNQFLLSIFFKTQALRDQAIAEIRKIDMEIKKNEETIQKSQQIINLAGQRTGTNARKAEAIAREALMKTQNAKRTNEETRKQWELQKIRADKSYATIQNMLSQKYDSRQQIKGFMTNYRGNVYIIKANGEKTSLDNGFLEPGDKVWTGNGTAEVQMLDGRADAKLGPYTEFVMKKDTPQEQVAELLKGKVYMAVDKIDEYAKKMKEKIDQYKEDVQTIKQLNKEDINDLENYIERKKFLLENHCCHSAPDGKIYCITAVVSVRGTKFTSEIKDNTMKVTVLEGIVDVNIPEKNKTLSVEAGNKAIIISDGTTKVEKIEQIERWWER